MDPRKSHLLHRPLAITSSLRVRHTHLHRTPSPTSIHMFGRTSPTSPDLFIFIFSAVSFDLFIFISARVCLCAFSLFISLRSLLLRTGGRRTQGTPRNVT
jgi:hypothetical protein